MPIDSHEGSVDLVKEYHMKRTVQMTPYDFLAEFTDWQKEVIENYNGTLLYRLTTIKEEKTYTTVCTASGHTREELVSKNSKIPSFKQDSRQNSSDY